MITLHGYKEENLFLIKNNVSKKIYILGRSYTFVFCSLMYAKKCLDLFLCAKNPVAFEHQMDYNIKPVLCLTQTHTHINKQTRPHTHTRLQIHT